MVQWTKEQINNHRETAETLHQIVQEAFAYIGNNRERITEREASDFICRQYRKHRLKSDKDRPIVAFGKNTAQVHYFPGESSALLQDGDLILIDAWAAARPSGSPYADITWMGYCGSKLPEEHSRVYQAVIKARDHSLDHIRESLQQNSLPHGHRIDEKARSTLREHGLDEYFFHSTGHSLGFRSPHGRSGGRISRKGWYPLQTNVGYTIEPGVYLKDRFGMRSEINFMITNDGELVVTTPVQEDIILTGL